MLRYRILLRKELAGGYTVTVPSLPGCVTYGATVEEAVKMAHEAIAVYLERLREHGEEISTEEVTLEYSLMCRLMPKLNSSPCPSSASLYWPGLTQ